MSFQANFFILFRFDLCVDVDDLPDQYMVSGFKPALIPLLPSNFNDFSEEIISDVVFGKKVKLYVLKNDERRDTIFSLEKLDD